jgi:hypothetical protein
MTQAKDTNEAAMIKDKRSQPKPLTLNAQVLGETQARFGHNGSGEVPHECQNKLYES